MATASILTSYIIKSLVVTLISYLIVRFVPKAEKFFFAPLLVWACFAWYYEFKLRHLAWDFNFTGHPFIKAFCFIGYDIGFYLSFILGLGLLIAMFAELAAPEDEKKSKGKKPERSPMPLFVAALIVGLLSAYMINKGTIAFLSALPDKICYQVLVSFFHIMDEEEMATNMPAYFLPISGLVAGTLVTAMFSRAYKAAKVPAACFLSLFLVPLLTAVVQAFFAEVSVLLIFILPFTAWGERNGTAAEHPRRSEGLYILLSIGIGLLSAFYYLHAGMGAEFFDNNGFIAAYLEPLMYIAGGLTGLCVGTIGDDSFTCDRGAVKGLCFLVLIPITVPGMVEGIAYIIGIIAAVVMLAFAGTGSASSSSGDYDSVVEDERGVRHFAHRSTTNPDTYISEEGDI